MIGHASALVLFTLAALALTTTTNADPIRGRDDGYMEAKFGPTPTAGRQCPGVTVPDNTAVVSVSWDSSLCGKTESMQNLLAEYLTYIIAYTDNGMASGSDPYFGIDDATYDALGWERGSSRTGYVKKP